MMCSPDQPRLAYHSPLTTASPGSNPTVLAGGKPGADARPADSETISRPDCVVVGAVTCEPSQPPKFPGSRELAGNFPESGVAARFLGLNWPARSVAYAQIPYASEQGIFRRAAGNFIT